MRSAMTREGREGRAAERGLREASSSMSHHRPAAVQPLHTCATYLRGSGVVIAEERRDGGRPRATLTLARPFSVGSRSLSPSLARGPPKSRKLGRAGGRRSAQQERDEEGGFGLAGQEPSSLPSTNPPILPTYLLALPWERLESAAPLPARSSCRQPRRPLSVLAPTQRRGRQQQRRRSTTAAWASSRASRTTEARARATRSSLRPNRPTLTATRSVRPLTNLSWQLVELVPSLNARMTSSPCRLPFERRRH